MKIAVIVYSYTGNTFSVAEKLVEKLKARRKDAKLFRLIMSGDPHMDSKNVSIKNIPDLNEYDAYVFASPVQAFTLSAYMKMYMKNIQPLNGKNVAVFVTQNLKPVFGGNRAIKKLSEFVHMKDGAVRGSKIIKWTDSERDKLIDESTAYLAGLFD